MTEHETPEPAEPETPEQVPGAAPKRAPRGRTSTRRSGRVAACGLMLGVLVLAVSALSAWYFTREPDGPILLVVPAGEDAILLRRGYEQRGYVHLVRWSPTRGMVWSEALFGIEFAREDDVEHLTVRVEGERIFVRAREARGHAELHVFALEDGAFQWRGGEPSAEPPEGRAPFGDAPEARLVFGEDHVWVVHGVHEGQVEVVALTREGEQVARVALPVDDGQAIEASVEDAYANGGVLWVLTRDGQLRTVSSSGRVDARLRGAEGLCRVGRYVFASNAEELHRFGGDYAIVSPAEAERSAFRPIPARVLGCNRDHTAAILETPGHEVALQREDGGAVFRGATPARVGRFGAFAKIGALVFATEGEEPRVVDLPGEVVGDVVVDGALVQVDVAKRSLPDLLGVATGADRVFVHDGEDVHAWTLDRLEDIE